jgi:hypothetical protein
MIVATYTVAFGAAAVMWSISADSRAGAWSSA